MVECIKNVFSYSSGVQELRTVLIKLRPASLSGVSVEKVSMLFQVLEAAHIAYLAFIFKSSSALPSLSQVIFAKCKDLCDYTRPTQII